MPRARTDPDTRASGSHFLDEAPHVVERILEAAALRPGEHVVDVGAGTGALTRPAAAAVQPGGSVFAIETDANRAGRLAAEDLPGVSVVQADALAVGLPIPVDAVVANPPYRILPALLRRLLDHGFGRAVLVMPRELCDRLTAQPNGEAYGKLTVQVALRAQTKLLFPLRRRDFVPPPAVPSVVVQVTPRPGAVAPDAAVLDAVLDAAWAARAKTLRHSLSPLAESLGVAPQDVTEALALANAGGRAATSVSPWEYATIAHHLVTARAERALHAEGERKVAQAARKARQRAARQARAAGDAAGAEDADADGEGDGALDAHSGSRDGES